MENSTKLYWLTRLDSLQGLCVATCIISAIVVGIYWLIFMVEISCEDDDEKEEYKQKYGGKARLATWSGLVSMIILMLAPTRSELIFIVAGGKTMDFIEKDKSIQALPSQTTELVSKYLDKKIKEIEQAENK